MKLIKCYVSSFGKLKDFTFDFTDGLNTIKEDNGWGKTTLATFIKSMFYGLNGNKRSIDDYCDLETVKLIIKQPLVLTDTLTKYDVFVNVVGGGFTGQAGAIRHGISRALIIAEPELRAALKKAGFLTRDPRMKERKKYGLKKARRAPQFSKR